MAAPSATIKAMEASAVHRIQSGQVIVSLCSVAKELVENGLDAGATRIEVRFRNQGLDGVEVQDNGSGIARHNYAGVARKHHTSKLASYADLATLTTFGFRGEALSSLCALAHVAVTTCVAADAPRGSRLEFDATGALQGEKVVAAQTGTTVAVTGLFHNLPVRRRELERNIKREWARVVALLQQYACITAGVAFCVSQQPTKGRRTVLFATGGGGVRDNVVGVYGAKTMASLLALDLHMTMSGPRDEDVDDKVHVAGFVSRPGGGQGRATPDRQMFFVNGRPCKLPQFARLFGEVYRGYNSTQAPFILADLRLDTRRYDVNVSPDKQTILLHEQGALLDALRDALVALFEQQAVSVPVSQLAAHRPLSTRTPTPTPTPTKTPIMARIAAFASGAVPAEAEPADAEPAEAEPAETEDGQDGHEQDSQDGQDDHEQDGHEQDSQDGQDSQDITDSQQQDEQEQKDLQESDLHDPPDAQTTAKRTNPFDDDESMFVDASDNMADDEPAPVSVSPTVLPSRAPLPRPVVTVGDTMTIAIPTVAKRPRLASGRGSGSSGSRAPRKAKTLPSFGGRLTQMFAAAGAKAQAAQMADEEDEDEKEEDEEDEEEVEEGEDDEDEEKDTDMADGHVSSDEDQDQDMADDEELDQDMADGLPSQETLRSADEAVADPDEPMADEDRTEPTDAERRGRLFLKVGVSKKRFATVQLVHTVQTSEAWVRQAWTRQKAVTTDLPDARAVAVDDTDTPGGLDAGEDAAQAKLALTIQKADFAAMRVVGQFNLGFVLAVRARSGTAGDDELFIVDQHASDEKYNFERLQATTVLQAQRLAQPKALDLTAVEEAVVVEHASTLAANGFVVEATMDGSRPVGRRCALTTLPLSQATVFGLGDLEELIALLADAPASTAVVRPSRVRAMLAMRACRSSIMVGTALSRRQMARVLAHMGQMDKPWNCPHGRPTMRHLCSLGAAWDAVHRAWGADDADDDDRPAAPRWGRFLKRRR